MANRRMFQVDRYNKREFDMARRGAGGPPSSGNSGNNSGPIYRLEEAVGGTSEPKMKMVKALKLRAGTDNQPILTLDDFESMDDGYSVNIHMFNLRGTKDNIVVCPKTESDPRPCPLCDALNKDPSWYVVLSAIDRQKYTFERKGKDGAMSEVTYTDLRRIVLVTQTWLKRMSTNGKRSSGFRGALFEVSRSKPEETIENGQKKVSWKDSPRIGDVWYFTKKLSDDEMRSELEQRSSDYGMPVEEFIQPFDYEVLLKPKTYEQLTQIADDLTSDMAGASSQANPSGTTSGGKPSGASSVYQPPTDAEIPY